MYQLQASGSSETNASTRLTADILGNASRLRADLTLHESTVLRYTVGNLAEATAEDRFREAIDEDGHVLQRIAYCAQAPQAGNQCATQTALVTFGWGNESGALGVAPAWNRTLEAATGSLIDESSRSGKCTVVDILLHEGPRAPETARALGGKIALIRF